MWMPWLNFVGDVVVLTITGTLSEKSVGKMKTTSVNFVSVGLALMNMIILNPGVPALAALRLRARRRHTSSHDVKGFDI